MEPTKNKGGRPPSKKKSEKPEATTHLDSEVDRAFTAHAKKLKLSKREYASAAIAYFAESGLNPAEAQGETLASFSNRQKEEGRAGRQQTVDVGNRLISIMRTWEKSLYVFLQQIEGGMVNHMEQIEANLLQQLVGLESSYFAPMVELMVKNNIESYIGRVVSERTGLAVTKKDDSEWYTVNQAMNKDRDQQLVIQMREFMKNNRLEKPTLSPKPQPPTIPAKAPAAPVTPAAGGTASK